MVADLLARIDDVETVSGAPQSVVVTEADAFPVEIEVLDAERVEERIARPEKDGSRLLLVVNAILDDETAARLEDAGISYVDATGRRWLRSWQRTKRSLQSAAGTKRGLYAASIRLGQLLSDHPDESWSERGLAKRGHTTQATAHRFLARLEKEGLIEREGQGRGTTRWVRDNARMRAWLAREGRPRRVTRLSCFVRDPTDLPELAGRTFALTGAAAAEAIGIPVLTRKGDPMVRVNVTADELEDIPEAIGGFRTAAGANLTLLADPDRLAFVDPYFDRGRRLIAPPSRIMLDLYLEARGQAAVDVFLDLWGDRVIEA